MVTKNFLFLALSLSSSFLAGCQTISHRQAHPSPVSTEAGTPADVGGNSSQPQSTESGGWQTPPQQTPARGTVLPVGIYFGPGAMRCFAHIGVLKAFQKAQIPIVAIGGVEWGGIVAASYATSRGANEVEWELMKLQKDQVPSPALLSHEVKTRDTRELFDFLKMAFGDKDLGTGTIPFRCSTTDGEETVFISSGKAREQLLRCASLPPMYHFYDRAGKTWVSGAVSPGDWAGELRKLGAQYVIYVDVLSRGAFLSPNKYPNEQQLKALWLAIKAISKQQHLFANMTVEVPSEIDLTEYDRRREAIALGENAANVYINSILHAIGVQ